MNDEFRQMIADAVLASDPHADPQHINRVTAGIAADSDWAPLTWMSREIASGHYATALAERAASLSSALKKIVAPSATAPTTDAKTLAAKLGMTEIEFGRLPPAKRRELHDAFAEREGQQQKVEADVAGLQAKAAAGTILPTERLTLARLTEEAPTKQQRRDPRFIQAQQERMSVPELEKLIRGHEQVYGSGQYPQVMRDEHRKHADRLRAIIKERESNNAA